MWTNKQIKKQMSNQRTGERNSAERIYTGKQAQSTHTRIDDWMNEQANQLSSQRKNERTNERPNDRMHAEQTNEHANEWVKDQIKDDSFYTDCDSASWSSGELGLASSDWTSPSLSLT